MIRDSSGARDQWPGLAGPLTVPLGDGSAGEYFPGPALDGPQLWHCPKGPFLGDCLGEDRDRLERYAVRHRFRAGDEIVREGQFDRSLIILLDGEFSFVTGQAGEEQVLSIIGAPSLVGEVGFFDPGPQPGTLRGRVGGEFLRLSFSRFEALMAACPLLGRMILLEAGRIMASRLRRAATKDWRP